MKMQEHLNLVGMMAFLNGEFGPEMKRGFPRVLTRLETGF
jgi:hypothetical protein